jgi:hypothetical protein
MDVDATMEADSDAIVLAGSVTTVDATVETDSDAIGVARSLIALDATAATDLNSTGAADFAEAASGAGTTRRAIGTIMTRARSAGTADLGSSSAMIFSTARLDCPLMRPTISSTFSGFIYFDTIATTVRFSSPDSSSG